MFYADVVSFSRGARVLTSFGENAVVYVVEFS